jgi:hypothetical protein
MSEKVITKNCKKKVETNKEVKIKNKGRKCRKITQINRKTAESVTFSTKKYSCKE